MIILSVSFPIGCLVDWQKYLLEQEKVFARTLKAVEKDKADGTLFFKSALKLKEWQQYCCLSAAQHE